MIHSKTNRDHEKENNGTAVRYIAIGAMLVIWSGTWLLYLLMPELMSGWAFVALGTILSGVVLTFAGFHYIQLNRQADRAEVEEAKELAEHSKKDETAPGTTPPSVQSRNYEEYRVDPQMTSRT
ncbi:hypothetical protein [Thalassoroseus pseudoceratinae]|uniref:hypothetical protein n=1 Tax=Thalassoroseus pseudoceratinae TaxID=2713176 RepID=UPI00141E8220|nr:hypothetical protein [Thalassoroseus pseudoceratinae]